MFRLRLAILAVVSVSVYSQETAAPSDSTRTALLQDSAVAAPTSPQADTSVADTPGAAALPVPDTIPAQTQTKADPAADVDTAASSLQSSDSTRAIPAEHPSPATSNFYGGSASVHPGTERGMRSSPTAGRTERTRIVDSVPQPPRGADSAKAPTVAEPDHLSTAGAGPAHDGDAPAASFRTPRKVKIIAAVGTATAIGCIIALLLKEKRSESGEADTQRIPDPPQPPGI